METLGIAVGQSWRTRDGRVVKITADRSEAHRGWPGVDTWRWAISTGHILDADGRADYWGKDSPLDLIERAEESNE